jgi:hypothetical protein
MEFEARELIGLWIRRPHPLDRAYQERVLIFWVLSVVVQPLRCLDVRRRPSLDLGVGAQDEVRGLFLGIRREQPRGQYDVQLARREAAGCSRLRSEDHEHGQQDGQPECRPGHSITMPHIVLSAWLRHAMTPAIPRAGRQ